MSKEKKEKTALFLVDCLAHMPSQPEQLQCVVDTAIAGLKRIADGQDWPEDEARATASAAVRAAARAAWAAANRAADWAARAHPDPDAERARQATVREKLGLNTKGA